jgi:glycosyltransferase involved in cell wall biosynthesis
VRPKLSVYIIAFNEAGKIADAVDSVSWADEVLVLDSGSTDDTAAIATDHGATVRQLPFSGFGKLRNDAISMCTHDWIFSLDADERCTPAAHQELLRVLQNPLADAYYVPRRNWFMGRWIKHCGWYPDYRQPQLFRRTALVFDEKEEVHESFEVHGRIGHLRSPIVQVPYQDLSQLINKIQRYSTLGAIKMERKGRQGTMGQALTHGLWAFFRIFVLKLGFLDGWAGFMLSLSSFESTFYRYAKSATGRLNWSNPPELPD